MTSTLSIRVYFEDTDFSGVVYHANYLRYFERGRTEAMREFGLGHAELWSDDDPRVMTVRSINTVYHAPARMDDLLSITTTLKECRGARLIFDQRAMRGDTLLVQADVVIACMDPTGRPRRIPPDLVKRLTQ